MDRHWTVTVAATRVLNDTVSANTQAISSGVSLQLSRQFDRIPF